jgi:zinc/manganese transport system substrate-binding protein
VIRRTPGVPPSPLGILSVLALLAVPLLFAACDAPETSAPAAGDPTSVASTGGEAVEDQSLGTSFAASSDLSTSTPLPVVATFSILGDIVAQVGGDRVAVTTLVGPGADTHTFEPAPADAVALVEAAVVFENGLGLEPWLNDLFDASGSKSRLAVVTDGLTLLPTPVEDAHTGMEHEAADDHAADAHQHGGESDPHVWHDVANVKQITEAVRDALIAADPDDAEVYRANTEAYLRELDVLDAYVIEQVDRIPPERRKLVTPHDTFRYLAARYGFEIIGTALASGSTDAGDPSAAHIAHLSDQIRAAGIPVIFAETVQNSRLIEQIAREAGVALGPPLYTDALGEAGTPGESYIGLMRANAEALAESLGSR